MLDISNESFPGKFGSQKGKPGAKPSGVRFNVDNSKAIRELGLQYTPKEATFKESMAQFVEIKEKSK